MNRGERRKRSFNKYIQRLKYWANTQNRIFKEDGKWRPAKSWKELFGTKGWWNFSKTTQSPALNRISKGYENKRGKKNAYLRMLDILSDTDVRSFKCRQSDIHNKM